MSALKKRQKEAGLCTQGCGRPLHTKWRCVECAQKLRKKSRDKQKKHLEKGLCTNGCGRPLHTKWYCVECTQKQRRYAKDRNRSLEGWAKMISASQKSKRGTALSPETIMSAWLKQGGKCALLGVPLVLGETASVDHIVAHSKGGASDDANIRIVHKAVNTAKSAMTDSEFAALVRKLIPWAVAQPGTNEAA